MLRTLFLEAGNENDFLYGILIQATVKVFTIENRE